MGVTIAGLDDHPVTGKKGHGPVAVDTTVDRAAPADFDALVIPGGYAPDKLRRSEAVLGLVREFDAAAKPIAFISHAGWVPISAKILKGRRATSVAAIRDDMMNAGADWVAPFRSRPVMTRSGSSTVGSAWIAPARSVTVTLVNPAVACSALA
jgi:protease I